MTYQFFEQTMAYQVENVFGREEVESRESATLFVSKVN